MTDETPVDDGPRCTVCTSRLWADELGRRACFRCQDQTSARLQAFAGPVTYARRGTNVRLVSGLYAALPAALMPGRSGAGGRSPGPRGSSLPARLGPLSLTARGGVVSILQDWAEDWHQLMDRPLRPWTGTLQQQVDDAVRTLRFNLEWAAINHPIFDQFAHEIHDLYATCLHHATGERRATGRTVTCSCGTTIGGITFETDSRRCPGCGTVHDWAGLCRLARKAAA